MGIEKGVGQQGDYVEFWVLTIVLNNFNDEYALWVMGWKSSKGNEGADVDGKGGNELRLNLLCWSCHVPCDFGVVGNVKRLFAAGHKGPRDDKQGNRL